MRILKIALTILCLYILQAVFGEAFGIMKVMPELLLGFAVIFAIREQKWAAVVCVTFVCAILIGTMPGRNFPLSILTVCAAAATANLTESYVRFVPKYAKSLTIIVCAEFVLSVCERMILTGTYYPMNAIFAALPRTAYTLAAAAVLYPLVGKILYNSQKKILIQ